MVKGEAQRVKGNAKPSSSAKAAEMLEQVSVNYSGISSNVAPIGIGTLLEDSFDSSIDSEFRMVLKKLAKKDNSTKQKSLEELKALIEAKSIDDCIPIAPYWAKSYSKLTIDNDRKIRELCQQTHEKLCNKINKHIAPHLKVIMPYWMLAQSDGYSNASKIAENLFKSMFNESKQVEAVYLRREDILNVLNNYLLVETSKTLSDMKATSQDEADQKYENVLCMSLRALHLFVIYYFSPKSKLFVKESVTESVKTNRLENLEKIIENSKFWKFSKDNSTKVRAEFFQLLNKMLECILLNEHTIESEKASDEHMIKFKKVLKSKLISVVFYACDEDDYTSAYFVWQAMEKCLKQMNLIVYDETDVIKGFWSLMNAKKAFLPKLIALLRSHANGNANSQNVDIVYSSCLCTLLEKLGAMFNTDNELDEKLTFFKDYLAKLYDAVIRDTTTTNTVTIVRFNPIESNKNRKITTFFECLIVVLDELMYKTEALPTDRFEKCLHLSSELILNNVVELYELYLDSTSETKLFSVFQKNFEKFLENILDKETTPNANPVVASLKTVVWTEHFEKLVVKKLLEKISDRSIVLKNFSYLYESYWNRENTSPTLFTKQKLNNLIDRLFNSLLDVLTDTLATGPDAHGELKSNISCVNILVKNFYSSNMLNLVVKNIAPSSSLDSTDPLSRLNESIMPDLIKKTTSDLSLLIELLELNISLNENEHKPPMHDNKIARFDTYLFGSLTNDQMKQFLRLYAQKVKTKAIDSTIVNLFTEWILNSVPFRKFIFDHYLNETKLYSGEDSLESLVNLFGSFSQDIAEKYETELGAYYQFILDKNLRYIQSSSASESENCLKFNLNLLSPKTGTKNIIQKYLTLNYLWSLLLNLVQRQEKNVQFEDILANSILKMDMNTTHYYPLYAFINENATRSNLGKLLAELVRLFAKSLIKIDPVTVDVWLQAFHLTILEKLAVNFKNVFEDLLLTTDGKLKIELLTNFHLDKRFDFIYGEYMQRLVNSNDESNDRTDLPLLNRINTLLKLVNSYLSNGSLTLNTSDGKNDLHRLLDPGAPLGNENWFYLLLAVYLIDRYYPMGEISTERESLVRAVKVEFKQLHSATNFFAHLLEHETVKNLIELFTSNNDRALNDLSFFLTYTVDLLLNKPGENSQLLMRLNDLAQGLIVQLVARNDSRLPEVVIRYYLYDLTFAKHSVVNNLSNLAQNVDHYYNLFDSLVQSTSTNLTQLAARLIEINESSENLTELTHTLKKFNSLLDVLVKYLGFYLQLLTQEGISDAQTCAKLVNIFNSNEKTVHFIRSRLAQHLLVIIDKFVDLKTSIGQGLKNLTGLLSAKHGGYFFYFNQSLFADPNVPDDFKWQSFVMLDKLNSFLRLLFVDYRFSCRGTEAELNFNQQLSQFLTEKQWDFVLCYVADIAQRLVLVHNLKQANRVHMKLYFVSYFTLLDVLNRCMSYRCRDNRTKSYPRSVHADYDGFFKKEIFDPLLVLYVQMCESYSDHKTVGYLMSRVIDNLGRTVSQITFERLLFNELEAKFNVLDLDLNRLDIDAEKYSQATSDFEQARAICLPDKLKTLVNHMVPGLRHKMGSVQLNSYRILRTLMKETSKYYTKSEPMNEEELNQKQPPNNLIDTLPHVIKETLFALTDLFSDLKNSIPFDQSILVSQDEEVDDLLRHETNNRIMSYMLANKLILDMFATDDLEFKVKLANNLREISLSEHLMNLLFRVMPVSKINSLRSMQNSTVAELEYFDLDEMDYDLLTMALDAYAISFSDEFVQFFACKLYKFVLKNVPAIARDWWNLQTKRIADSVDKFTTKYVSPVLIEDEIRQVNRLSRVVMDEPDKTTSSTPASPKSKKYVEDDEEQSTIKIKGMLTTREIVSTYKMKELNMELVIQLPVNYPLGVVKVSVLKRIGVSENEWRNWLLQLTTYLTHQNGSIIQGLQIWKRNVDKKFSGVEECTICYSVIHGTNYQLPKMKCRTCKKLFHSICLYKWFESSSKSTCPLCRNLF